MRLQLWEGARLCSLCPTGNRKSLEDFKHRKGVVRFVFLKDHSDYCGAEKVMW